MSPEDQTKHSLDQKREEFLWREKTYGENYSDEISSSPEVNIPLTEQERLEIKVLESIKDTAWAVARQKRKDLREFYPASKNIKLYDDCWAAESNALKKFLDYLQYIEKLTKEGKDVY